MLCGHFFVNVSALIGVDRAGTALLASTAIHAVLASVPASWHVLDRSHVCVLFEFLQNANRTI